MTPSENAQEALVVLCGYIVTAPTYGSSEAMWRRDLAEVLRAVGAVPKPMRPLYEAALSFQNADSARARRNAHTRLRIEVGAYFERRAVDRVAALRDMKGAA